MSVGVLTSATVVDLPHHFGETAAIVNVSDMESSQTAIPSSDHHDDEKSSKCPKSHIELVALPDHTGNACNQTTSVAKQLSDAIWLNRGFIQCDEAELNWLLWQDTEGITYSVKVQSLVDLELDKWCPAVPPKVFQKRKETAVLVMESRRVKRRRFYAHVQRLYAKDRGLCADHVLSGDWERQGASCPKEKLVEFWAPLFETQSVPDDRVVTPVTTTRNDLTSPILVAEVDSATRNSKSKGSPGPDGLRLCDAKALSSRGLAVHFNLWMLLACSPTRFRVGRTTLYSEKGRLSRAG